MLADHTSSDDPPLDPEAARSPARPRGCTRSCNLQARGAQNVTGVPVSCPRGATAHTVFRRCNTSGTPLLLRVLRGRRQQQLLIHAGHNSFSSMPVTISSMTAPLSLGVIPRGMTQWEASFSLKCTIAYLTHIQDPFADRTSRVGYVQTVVCVIPNGTDVASFLNAALSAGLYSTMVPGLRKHRK